MLPSKHKATTFFLLLALAVLTQGCERRWAVVEQSIADDPVDLLQPAGLHREEEVFRWQISLDPEANAWTVQDGGELSRRGREVILSSPVAGPTMERTAELSAKDIDLIEVKLSNLRVGKVAVSWTATEDDGTALTGRLEATSTHPYHANFKTYRFTVGNHPAWRGAVERITVSTDSAAEHPVGVRYVRGLALRLDAERFEEALAIPWKVQLDDETRSAWLTPPGHPRRWTLTPPANAKVRFTFGLAGTSPQPHDFVLRLVAGSRDESGAEAADPPVELLRERREESGWIAREVDLAAYSGRPVTLEFGSELNPNEAAPRDVARATITQPLWGHPQLLAPTSDKRQNVLLILVDTLRADRLSLYGHSRATSPTLDAWAADGAVFEHAVAAAPWTLPSHVSMFTGLDAQRHGVSYNNDRLGHELTLAEILRRRGWATEAITGGGFLGPQYGLGRGFEAHWSWNARRRQKEELEVGVDRALERLAALEDRPFFLFFHTYEVHSPFSPRSPWFEEFSGAEETPHPRPEKLHTEGLPATPENGFQTRYRFTLGDERRPLSPAEQQLPGDLYDSAVAYTDQQLGRLLAGLEDLGLADDTLVILTSDHGEMLGEDGLASHAYLRPENLRVPLVLVAPGHGWAGARVPDLVRGVDLTPTVLDFLELEIPPGLDGVSLLPLIAGDRSRAPRAAWSYAGSTNHGLAVELRGRAPFIFQDSPWRAPESLTEGSAEAAPNTHSAAERESLRAWSEQRLREDPVGLFVTFRNDGAEPLKGRLEGEQFTQVGLKILGPSSALESTISPVRWVDRKTFAFEVPPATTFEMVFRRRLRGDSLRVVVDGAGGDAIFEFPLKELAAAPARLSPSGSGWQLATSAQSSDSPAEIILRMQGDGANSEPELDDELRAQLRALGYLD